MVNSPRKTQLIFLSQECYIPVLIERFLTARKAEGLSRCTLKDYRDKLTMFLSFCEAQAVTQIQEVNPDFLRRFMLKLAETHNPGGQHGFYRVVRAFLLFVEADEVLPEWRSPTRKVKAPRVEIEPIEGVTLADLAAILGTCDKYPVLMWHKSFTGARDIALLLALLDTGARVTEFLSVDLGDVDPAGITLRHTKGKRARVVYLSQKTRKAIRAYLRLRHDASPALWVSRYGDRLSYDGVRGILTRRAKLAGVTVPGAHDFRRCFALNYIRNGGDIFSLARILGHKNINILKRYLAHTDQDAQLAHAEFSPVDTL